MVVCDFQEFGDMIPELKLFLVRLIIVPFSSVILITVAVKRITTEFIHELFNFDDSCFFNLQEKFVQIILRGNRIDYCNSYPGFPV